MLTRQELSIKIGDRIKAVRKQKGLSQAALSKLCKKDKQHIELIENHKVTPNVYTLYIISDALAVELRELLEF